MTKRRETPAKQGGKRYGHADISGATRSPGGDGGDFDQSAPQSPAEFFASVLADPQAETSEKIRAAKELDTITRRAGNAGSGRIADMSREDIQAEIARVHALLGREVLDF